MVILTLPPRAKITRVEASHLSSFIFIYFFILKLKVDGFVHLLAFSVCIELSFCFVFV